MLKSSQIEIINSIEEYAVNAKHKYINVQIATGKIVDDEFVSDGRGLINHRIANIEDCNEYQTDVLIVDVTGQVTLSHIPIDNKQILINDVLVDHAIGQTILCDGYIEGDEVTISYYYLQQGRNWFKEAGAFKQANHPEFVGLDDYHYNGARLWSILLEMGLVTGTMVE